MGCHHLNTPYRALKLTDPVAISASSTRVLPETAPLDEIVSTVDTGISIQSVSDKPAGTKTYTVSTETNEVIPVDLTTLTNLAAIAVGSAPQGIVIHPDGSVEAKSGTQDIGTGTRTLVAIIAAVALTLRHRPGSRRQDPAAQVRVQRDERVRIVKMDPEPRQGR